MYSCVNWFYKLTQWWYYNEQLDQLSCQLDIIIDIIDKTPRPPQIASRVDQSATPTPIQIPPPPPILTPPTVVQLNEAEMFELHNLTSPRIEVQSTLLNSLKSEIAKRGTRV
jgi:hypothetical protein